MTAGRSLLSFVVALLPLTAVAAEKASPTLPVVLRCEACTDQLHPSVGLLWRADEGAEPVIGSLETEDWPAGKFLLVTPAGRVELQGERLEDGSGWSIAAPLPDGPTPFRLVVAADGFTADRTAWWPEREAGPFVITLEPTNVLLDREPDWDPGRTAECDVMLPKSAPTPVTFFVEGQPRAWLYPAAAADDGTPQWTFQFVKPGQLILERVNVTVPAFDEGESWAFRLPLARLLSGGARWSADATPRASDAGSVDEVVVSGVGALRLSDCPRAAR